MQGMFHDLHMMGQAVLPPTCHSNPAAAPRSRRRASACVPPESARGHALLSVTGSPPSQPAARPSPLLTLAAAGALWVGWAAALKYREHRERVEYQEEQEELRLWRREQEPEQGRESTFQQAGKQGSDLCRVVLVARSGPPPIAEDFMQQLVQQTAASSGYLLRFPSVVLLVLEAPNQELLLLLRRMMVAQSGLQDPKVVSYVLGTSARWFLNFTVGLPVGRIAGRLGQLVVPEAMDEAKWGQAVQGLDDFIRACGTRLQGLSDRQRQQMLLKDDMQLLFGSQFPEARTLLSLASCELSPNVRTFVQAWDADYQLYDAVMQGNSTVPITPTELERLDTLYKDMWSQTQQDELQRRPAATVSDAKLLSPLANLYLPRKNV